MSDALCRQLTSLIEKAERTVQGSARATQAIQVEMDEALRELKGASARPELGIAPDRRPTAMASRLEFAYAEAFGRLSSRAARTDRGVDRPVPKPPGDLQEEYDALLDVTAVRVDHAVNQVAAWNANIRLISFEARPLVADLTDEAAWA